MFMIQVQVQFFAVYIYMQLKNTKIENEKLDFVRNYKIN